MLTNNQKKNIQSLQQKKYRNEHQAFLVEGAKSVVELLDSDFEVELYCLTTDFYKENTVLFDKQTIPIEIVSENDLERMGTFQSNNAGLAIVKTKANQEILASDDDFVLVLDDIRDPGNLGTIIRIADWYGISKIVCSNNTVEFYNPKVIAATMGSFARVNLFYTDLPIFFQKQQQTVYGAFLDGENIHQTAFKKGSYVVIGNESNGISSEVAQFVNNRVTIPRFGKAESLNAGIATAIFCDNLRR
jgi:RNA methyltransferase, TrmH family